MEPAYTTFEQAKCFKEKGFNEPCDGHLVIVTRGSGKGKKIIHRGSIDYDEFGLEYVERNIPEQWQVVEWLRVNHGINVLPIESYTYPDEIKNRWKYQIINKQEKNKDIFNKKFFIESDYEFQSPQEAYSAAFDYIKNNNLI